MKSMSINLADKRTSSTKFDFSELYKRTSEIDILLRMTKTEDNNATTKKKVESTNTESSVQKSRNKKQIAHTSENINIQNTQSSSGNPVMNKNVSSNSNKNHTSVKSIMKNSSFQVKNAKEILDLETSNGKRKKRNKSVSFMLDDIEQVAKKKIKSNDSLCGEIIKKNVHLDKFQNSNKYEKSKNIKKNKQLISEKENKLANLNSRKEDYELLPKEIPNESSQNKTKNEYRQKKLNKNKREKSEELSPPPENEYNHEKTTDIKDKKQKKEKRKPKFLKTMESTDGEPQSKSRKTGNKPDVIAENLENLSIGDNTHTLTNLLDEMTMAEKTKNRKTKSKKRINNFIQTSSDETNVLEKIEEDKEKIEWKKRKWNKDKKGEVNTDELTASVIIENLPLSTMTSYKRLLLDHFSKFGIVKKIGIAEVYPNEDTRPVFTTSIFFDTELAATKALEEDNMMFEGSRIHLKRPLPATETTIVVRSYAELTQQNLSSAFAVAGKIRNIRHLTKGKKSIGTSFIDFHGPEAVMRALELAKETRIGGKKIHAAKFEERLQKNNDENSSKKSKSKQDRDSETLND